MCVILGESFKFAGPLASMVGMSVDDLAAAFMTMAQSGIKGSEAGVAMRSAIVRMLRPTKGMRAELAKLGIDLNDYITGAKEMNALDLVTSFKAQGFDLSAIQGQLGKLFADPKLREDGAEFFCAAFPDHRQGARRHQHAWRFQGRVSSQSVYGITGRRAEGQRVLSAFAR